MSKKHIFENQTGIKLEVLPSGEVSRIFYKELMLNQFAIDKLNEGVTKLYVRFIQGDKVVNYPLFGHGVESTSYSVPGGMAIVTTIQGVEFTTTIRLADSSNTWFYSVVAKNSTGKDITVDFICTQDIGMASQGALETNEAYNSQYVDMSMFDSTLGPVLYTRQNAQRDVDSKKANPVMITGCLSGAVGYLTDGFDFYQNAYKFTGVPEALTQKTWNSRVRQYEFTLSALQSKSFTLNSDSVECNFFAHFEVEHALGETYHSEQDIVSIQSTFKSLTPAKLGAKLPTKFVPKFELLNGCELQTSDIDSLFGSNRRHEEMLEGKLASFFCNKNSHVVTAHKELFSERTHGHLIRSSESLVPTPTMAAATMYMTGMFNSHLTFGNTSLNRVLSNSRSMLNLFKFDGQRVFAKLDGIWKQLNMPSAFEMGINFSKWYYQLEGRMIVVTTWVAIKSDQCNTTVEVVGNPLELFVTTKFGIAGTCDIMSLQSSGVEVIVKPDAETMFAGKHPNSTFVMNIKSEQGIEAKAVGSVLNYAHCNKGGKYPYIGFESAATNLLLITFNRVDETAKPLIFETFEEAIYNQERFYESLMKKVNSNSWLKEDKIFEILPWFVHNALVHFLVPRGLEQYTGAAWGVRDVCQGPLEFFIALKEFEPVKYFLKKVFEHQYLQTGDWPQWFMFDEYVGFEQEESHGDVKFWPVKALCDYIEASNDFSILSEVVGYTDAHTRQPVEKTATILEHAMHAVKLIQECSIPGTSLVSYGDGDWNDSLQPAKSEYRKKMISGWTPLLSYHTLTQFSEVLNRFGKVTEGSDMKAFCKAIQADYQKYMMNNGVSVGFTLMQEGNVPMHIIHEEDKATNIRYSLLPLTRGMICQFYTKEQQARYFDIIERELLAPDGARLMSETPEYKGGANTFFKRAEFAAAFSREIGLQYVHAHLRYIEASCAIGEKKRAYDGLKAINPILNQDSVKNANTRQSNCYYSSSDAAFLNRWDANAEYDKVKTGDVQVDGGWRVYSSGPGIYVGQFIRNILGFKNYFDQVIVDPILSTELNGLHVNTLLEGYPVDLHYHVVGEKSVVSKMEINGEMISKGENSFNLYREGGIVLDKSEFYGKLSRTETNTIHIWC